jgi:predicted O-methyltransferase YrrM
MKIDIDKILSYSLELEYDFSNPILSCLSDSYVETYKQKRSYIKFISALSILNNNFSYLEMGTEIGSSLIAYLYGNKSNKITSLDEMSVDDCVKYLNKRGLKVNSLIPEYLKQRIEFIVGSALNYKFNSKYDVIFVDTTHNGIAEVEIMRNLELQNMLNDCVILFDDIYFNNAMFNFWNSLKFEKRDLSKELNRRTGFGVVLVQ